MEDYNTGIFFGRLPNRFESLGLIVIDFWIDSTEYPRSYQIPQGGAIKK